MPEPLSRRERAETLGCAGAGVAFRGGILRGQPSPIVIAGRPVEIAVLAVSPSTVRITALPLDGAVADDGALVPAAAGRILSTRRTAGPAGPLRAGNLRVAFASIPPALDIVTANGTPVQRLTFDEKSGGLTFSLGGGPLLGFGEGGAQFDRRGVVDRMRNGQGGYQLRTHGGRVPIQWLIGTGAAGRLFIHQPLGSFDLTGPYGTLTPIGRQRRPSTSSSRHRRESGGNHAGVRTRDGIRGAAAALDVRLPAVAPDAGGAGRGPVGRENVPREAAAVRRA